MSSNRKLLQAWKNLDVVLRKDPEEIDDFGFGGEYLNMAKTAQSVKNSHIPSRPQSSYVTRPKGLLGFDSTKSFTRSPLTVQNSFYLTGKTSPFNQTAKSVQQGLVQMFSPKAKYFDDNTELHSISVQDLKRIYEKKCIDTKNESNPNQLNFFIDRFDKNCKKKVLNLDDQYIGPNAAIEIAAILAENTHFINANLSRNALGDVGAVHVAHALRQNYTIIHLDLANNGIGHEGAAAVFEMLAENETLISLSLNSHEGLNRNRIDSRGIKPIAQALKENQTLQFLDLSGSSITMEGATYLAMGLEHNKNLVSLNISDNELGPKVQPLVRALGTCNIIELNISNNKIGDAGLQLLLSVFQQGGTYSTRIQTLDLSSNNITGFGATKLFDVMLKNASIKKLIMNHNPLTGRGISSMVNMLWENPIVSYLSLYDCELNYEGADALGIGLARNFHVDTLIVGKNPFKDEGIKLLTSNLKDNNTIQVFDFSGCKIREEGGKAIAELIATNHNITHVDLKDNYLNDGAGIALTNAVKVNKKILKLDLERNMTSYKYITDIQRSLKSNSMDIKKESAFTFVSEMTHLKEFEGQKHVVAHEGKIFNAKQAEVNEELDYAKDEMDQAKKEFGDIMEHLEDESVNIFGEQRRLDLLRHELDEGIQQAKADLETELHFTKFNIENTLQEIDELTRGIRRLKEGTDQSRISYERTILKLKTEIADRERVINVLESTVNSTENQINRIRDDKASGSRSPGKKTTRTGDRSPKRSPGDTSARSPKTKLAKASKEPNKGFGAFVSDLGAEKLSTGEKSPKNDSIVIEKDEVNLVGSPSTFKLQPIGAKEVEKKGTPKVPSKNNLKGSKSNPKLGKAK